MEAWVILAVSGLFTMGTLGLGLFTFIRDKDNQASTREIQTRLLEQNAAGLADKANKDTVGLLERQITSLQEGRQVDAQRIAVAESKLHDCEDGRMRLIEQVLTLRERIERLEGQKE